MGAELKVESFSKNIEILQLDEWLNCASGCDTSLFVALPLIQRGFVWKPKQIIDLWDTLLRGMPMGSLMYNLIPPGVEVREVGGKDLIKTPESGAIGLIDGQQRTLAMLIPWEKVGEKMDRRIWVDFADKPSDEHLFRLYVTTKNQPFGFQKISPSTKLSLGERTKARDKFLEQHKKIDLSQDFLFKMAQPYHAIFPLDLRTLIDCWICQSDKVVCDKVVWINKIEELFEKMAAEKLSIDDLEQAKIRISRFADALERFFALQIPLLKVDPALFSVTENDNSDLNGNNDPPLALLFKRIGTGGTPLSDADYAYSIIKNLHPETYTLVEGLYSAGNIASLLSPTDLVMTAVRLAAAEYKEKLTDWESPRKIEFHRLIKHDGFLVNGFLPLIRSDVLSDAFTSLTILLKFDEKNNTCGLPLHAFPLLNRPLIQVLLRWIRIVQLKVFEGVDVILEQSRGEVLRFVMYWQLSVTDQRKASLIAFQQLKDEVSHFPGKEMYNSFISEQVAIPIFSPEKILEIKPDVVYSSDATRLRGWERFDTQQANTEKVKQVVTLYQRWWGNGHYVHPLLLWLQRKTVAEFDGSPVAGREEDTPYDYDHICPANHWGNWTGSSKGNRLIDFLAKEDNGGHWRTGNSIGNLRVWQSGENRSYGDAAPSEKLKFDDPRERDKLLQQSAIDFSQIEDWKICSDGEKCWNETRTQAFQQVIEQRAFSLYKCFYSELDFSKWIDINLIQE